MSELQRPQTAFRAADTLHLFVVACQKYWKFSGVFAGTPTTADCVSTTARADRADLFHSCPHHPEPQWLQCFQHSLSQGKAPLGLSQEKKQQAASALNQKEHTTMRSSEDS